MHKACCTHMFASMTISFSMCAIFTRNNITIMMMLFIAVDRPVALPQVHLPEAGSYSQENSYERPIACSSTHFTYPKMYIQIHKHT